jgi:hypothetical protein
MFTAHGSLSSLLATCVTRRWLTAVTRTCLPLSKLGSCQDCLCTSFMCLYTCFMYPAVRHPRKTRVITQTLVFRERRTLSFYHGVASFCMLKVGTHCMDVSCRSVRQDGWLNVAKSEHVNVTSCVRYLLIGSPQKAVTQPSCWKVYFRGSWLRFPTRGGGFLFRSSDEPEDLTFEFASLL